MQPSDRKIPLDDVALAKLDKADDLHRAAALGALQRIDFLDLLDQPGPCGKRTGTRASSGGFLRVEG